MRRTGVLSLLVMALALVAPAAAQRETPAVSVAPAIVEASCVDVVQAPSMQLAVIDTAALMSIAPLVAVSVVADSVIAPLRSQEMVSSRDTASAIESLRSTSRTSKATRGSQPERARSLFHVAGALHNRLRLHATVRT